MSLVHAFINCRLDYSYTALQTVSFSDFIQCRTLLRG